MCYGLFPNEKATQTLIWDNGFVYWYYNVTIASGQTSKSNLLQVAKVRYSRHYNLGSGIGLLIALQAIRRVIKGGAVWLAAPCSQWVWLSRGSTYRCRLRVGGDKRLPKVKLANRLVRRLCYLSLACVSKAYLRNTRHQFFIFAGLFEMFARKILKLYLWNFWYVLLLTTWGWNIPQRRGHSGFWSSRLHHCYRFTDPRGGVYWLKDLCCSQVCDGHGSSQVQYIWGMTSINNQYSKPVGFTWFPNAIASGFNQTTQSQMLFPSVGDEGGPHRDSWTRKTNTVQFEILKTLQPCAPKMEPNVY